MALVKKIIRIGGGTCEKTNVNKGKYGYVFIAPYFIIFSIFGAFPILYTFYLSLTNWNGIGKAKIIGFKNFATVFMINSFFKA